MVVILLAENPLGMRWGRLMVHACIMSCELEGGGDIASANLMANSKDLLVAVCTSFIPKFLFLTNGEALQELAEDDSPPEPPTITPSQPYLASYVNDGVDEGDRDDILMEERVELEETIKEGVELLRLMARIPDCLNALTGQVTTLLPQAIAALENSDPSTATMDVCTLLELVSLTAAHSPNEPYWSTLALVLNSTQQMATNRLYSRGIGNHGLDVLHGNGGFLYRI